MARPFRTFQDLDDRIDELGYSARTTAQIRPQLRLSTRIYKAPLSRIPACPAAFEERWGRGRIAAVAEGFVDHDEFVEWRRRVRPALGRAAGHGAARGPSLLPEWKTVLDFVVANGGIGRRLPPHLEHSVGAVARAASAEGLAPRGLDDAAVARLAGPLKGTGLRSYRHGVDRINDLVAARGVLPEIAALLPEGLLAPPPERQAPSSPWRRRGGLREARRLWTEFDQFVLDKRGRDALGRPIPAKDSTFGAVTETRYADALQQALNTLERFGELCPGDAPGLRDVCNADTIKRVAQYWNVRQIDGEVKKRGTMLYTLVCRLAHIAERTGAKKKERKELKALRKRLKDESGEVGKMMAERVEWVRGFAANPALQRAVLGMPEELMRRADRVLARWDELKRQGKQKERMDALKMGVTACAAAILFRAAPLRAANLRHLRYQGDAATLLGVPLDDEGGSGGELLRIAIPREQVKNRRDIEQDADDDALPIVQWYLREVRPKLISDHPYGVKLADGDWLFPSTREDRPLEETTFAGHYARGCERAGVGMCFHLARHITVYLILSANPNALAQAAAVLDDQIPTVREHYAWLDTKAASAEGRALVRQSRAAVRRHRKGTHRAA